MESKNELLISSICEVDRKRFDKDLAWQRFLARTNRAHEPKGRKNPWPVIWRTAAAAAIVFIVSYASFRQGSKQMNVQLENVVVESQWGSQVKTGLPDGTQVWLNADSKLTCSQGFGIDDRKVYLSGEGYFEVARNEKLPFSVQTDDLRVSVLGTRFNVRNYAGDREATVCLLEGKLSVGNHIRKGDKIVMEPDQKIFLDKKNGTIRLTTIKEGNAPKWTNGDLFFDDELISDIAKELERSYDVTITIHPDLANTRFYGSFIRKDVSIKDILNILAATGKMKYTISGKEIKLAPSNP